LNLQGFEYIQKIEKQNKVSGPISWTRPMVQCHVAHLHRTGACGPRPRGPATLAPVQPIAQEQRSRSMAARRGSDGSDVGRWHASRGKEMRWKPHRHMGSGAGKKRHDGGGGGLTGKWKAARPSSRCRRRRRVARLGGDLHGASGGEVSGGRRERVRRPATRGERQWRVGRCGR
jgi:hypothetical protein